MPRIALIGVSVGVLAILAYGRMPRAGERVVRGPYVGSYFATVTNAEAEGRGDPRLAGRFSLVLRRNGTYSDSNPLDGPADGRLEALAFHRLRFSDDSACDAAGLERAEGGIYRWSMNGERLTLRLIREGACSGRTDTLTFPVWMQS